MGGPDTLEFPPVYTTVDGDLVRILTATGFGYALLVRRGARDQWGITMPDGSLSFGEVLVTDTGTRAIDASLALPRHGHRYHHRTAGGRPRLPAALGAIHP